MIDPAQLTRDLGGNWHSQYGTAPCPVCQIERRKGQNAQGVTSNEGRLLLNCKKLGCDFRDILTACGLAGGTFEVDQMALENAKAERIAQAKLVIATDGDEAGKVAGDKLAMRASALGWRVSLLPAPNGKDWNDVLQKEVAA